MKIIAICGKSGTGKDYLWNYINTYASDRFNCVKSVTSRPARREGDDDHVYTSLGVFTDHPESFLITSWYNGWYYGVRLADLDSEKPNVIIASPADVEALEKKDIELYVYQLHASDRQRLLRSINRMDEVDMHEIMRRYYADEQDFANFNLDRKYPIYVNENTQIEYIAFPIVGRMY